MKNLVQQLNTYYNYHTKRATQITHFIGIPCVIFSLLIALSWVKIGIPPFFMTDLAWFFVISTLIYYYFLDMRLAALMTLIMAPVTIVAVLIGHSGPNKGSIITFLALFVGGWIFQLAGHLIEGKRPALVGNFSQIFIAPLFLLVEVLFIFGYRRDLKNKVFKNNKLDI